MPKILRDLRLIVAFVLLLFAGLAFLSYMIVSNEENNSQVIAEYEAERIATSLSEAIRVQGASGISVSDPRVLGFGLYGLDGVLIARFGAVPPTIDVDTSRSSFTYDDKAQRLFLTRQLGMGAMGGMGEGRMRDMRQALGLSGHEGGFIYLSLDESDFYQRKSLLALASILIPLLVASIAAAFIALFMSNLRYRKNAEERETLARLGESARTLAHEIRNPLGAIRIQTALARQGLRGNPSPELDAIDEEIERLSSLSRRVSDFLKDPAGHPESVDLPAFLSDIALRSPYHPSFNSDGKPATVSFDKELLRSAIENLIRNAAESYESAAGDASKGERPIELTLAHGLGRESHRLIVRVRDRGVGISETARDKIFDPFYTEKTQGSGIGLPLAKRFIEAAGGSLSLSRREGGGTEALIALPIAGQS